MKTYLIREVTGIIVSDDFASQKLIQPDLFNALTQKLFFCQRSSSSFDPRIIVSIGLEYCLFSLS